MENAAWAILFLLVSVVPLFLQSRPLRERMFDPENLFVLYLAAQIGGTGLLTVLSHQATILGESPVRHPDLYARVFWVSTAGMAAFHLGSWLVRSRYSAPENAHRAKFSVDLAQRVYIISALVGYVAIVIFIQSQGGLSAFLESRENFRGTVSGAGPEIAPISILFPCAAMAYAIALMGPACSKRDMMRAALVVASAIPPVFILGFRILIVPPIFMFGALYHYRYQPVDLRKVGLTAVLLVAGLSAYGLQRTLGALQNAGIQLDISSLNVQLITEQVLTRSMGAEVVGRTMSQLDATQAFVSPVGSLIEAATIMVPRQAWKDKPTPRIIEYSTTFFGSSLAERDNRVEDSYGGISPTAIGEFYWFGGPLAVVICMFGLGCASSAIWKLQRANRLSDTVLILFLLVMWEIGYAAETPQLALNQTAINGFVCVALAYFLRRPR